MSSHPTVRRSRRGLALAAVLTGLLGSLTVAPQAASAEPDVPVVITSTDEAQRHVVDLVGRQGGTVTGTLDALDVLVATLPADRIDEVASAPGVLGVSYDRPLHTTGTATCCVPHGYDPTTDTGDPSFVARSLGVDQLWAAGHRGQGIDIAIVDTGVTGHVALWDGAKVKAGAAFVQRSAIQANWDANGHGTHMASIAAGRTWDASTPVHERTNRQHFNGIAPEAGIVPVKVAEDDGTTTLSQVMQGIEWVIQNRNTGGRNIRVMNLSIAATPLPRPSEDPLAHAAVAAWNAGIVVVAANGNNGSGAPVSSPAYEPRIISVGATDPRGTLTLTDDWVAGFTSGTFADVWLPGVSLVGALGSHSAAWASGTRIGSEQGRSFVRGSGTSQATAVMSGVAAVLLSAAPDLRPDHVAAGLSATLRGTSNGLWVPSLQQNVLAARTNGSTQNLATAATAAGGAGGDINFARRGATWSTDAWARRGATWSGRFAAHAWR